MSVGDSRLFFSKIKENAIVIIADNVELNNGIFVSFVNNANKKFSVQVSEINKFINVLKTYNKEIINDISSHDLYDSTKAPWTYQEKPYRSLAEKYFPLNIFSTINPLIGSQTNGIYSAINSYICFLVGKDIDSEKFNFDLDTVTSAIEIIDNYNKLLTSNIKLQESGFTYLLGPFTSVKIAALESLYYCFENNSDTFINNIVIDEYKASTPFSSVYLWASQKGLDEKNLDARVFKEKPFKFKGNSYFLSDQWTFESVNGRSIKDINNVLNLFGYEITQNQDKFYLVKLSKFTITSLPKPFLLLAGISGTGKTRFVREQADASASVERYHLKKDDNYCLIPVRPDWHEPSDLLGYISRIGNDGPRYVTTDLLHFIIAAWRHAVASASVAGLVYKPLDTICPFWLCLDEMNLAPVEQYFADYLSILETRRWEDGIYSCDPLLKSAVIQQQLGESGRKDFWEKLNMEGDDPLSSGLRDYFSTTGIPLPPNLIVAGTVNMDETTHGFSRKVIDRALTIDFGEFFKNDYGQFFKPENRPKTLGFPVLSHITRNDLFGVKADPDGQETIGLLEAVNGILKNTPFELAYRALNEALLSVVCFNPSDGIQLQAVWDDFLMMKVLPRIEGDADKLYYDGEVSLLTRLSDILQGKLSDIWDTGRPDLLSEKAVDGSPVMTFCRSKKKLAWMQNRLAVNAFTTFWP